MPAAPANDPFNPVPDFALVAPATQDLLNALQYALKADVSPFAQAEIAREALAAGAEPEPPPPVRVQALTLLAQGWPRSKDFRQAMGPVLEPVLALASPAALSAALGTLLVGGQARQAADLQKRLQARGAQIDPGLLYPLATTLGVSTDARAVATLEQLFQTGWTPAGTVHEARVLGRLIDACLPKALDTWLACYARADQRLPTSMIETSSSPLSVVIALRNATPTTRSATIRHYNQMAWSLAASGLLSDTPLADQPAAVVQWLQPAVAEGARQHLDRRTAAAPSPLSRQARL